MKMSLRKKQALLIALAIIAAVVPYSLYSAANFAAESMEKEQANVEMLGALVSDNLNAFYYNYLTDQMADIIRHKDQLRKISLILSRHWSNMEVLEDALRNRLIGRQASDLKDMGLVIAVLDRWGKPLHPFDNADFAGRWAKVVDFTGRPLISGLNPDNLPADGRFSVYKLEAVDGSVDTYLGLLMRDASDENIIVNMIKINSLQSQMMASPASVVDDLRRRLADIQLSPGAGISLMNSGRRVLVHQGPQPQPAIPGDLYDEARLRNKVEKMADLGASAGRALVRVEYFKPLDWYVVLAVPEATIIGPARALALKMILAGGLVALISIVIGLAAGNMLIKPLLLLNRKALAAAEVDLNSPEAETFFTRDLPTGRNDEIGHLASAFSTMGLALAAKVRELVAGTASRVRLEGELAAARDIQLGMLPDSEPAPSSSGCRIQAYLHPAKEVGGDLYDYFTAPCGRQVVVIGDVSDKGVPAALFMAMTSTLIRQAIAVGLEPAEVLEQVNERLTERNPSSMFVTLFIGLLDPETGAFSYANAGHCFPLIYSADGSRRFLEGKSGPMVGIFSGIAYRGFSDIINKIDLCFLYTDGVTEAQNEAGDFFGQERLMAILDRSPDLTSPAAALESVREAVLEFQGEAPQADDITMLAFVRG